MPFLWDTATERQKRDLIIHRKWMDTLFPNVIRRCKRNPLVTDWKKVKIAALLMKGVKLSCYLDSAMSKQSYLGYFWFFSGQLVISCWRIENVRKWNSEILPNSIGFHMRNQIRAINKWAKTFKKIQKTFPFLF